jgi:hypothetical protein
MSCGMRARNHGVRLKKSREGPWTHVQWLCPRAEWSGTQIALSWGRQSIIFKWVPASCSSKMGEAEVSSGWCYYFHMKTRQSSWPLQVSGSWSYQGRIFLVRSRQESQEVMKRKERQKEGRLRYSGNFWDLPSEWVRLQFSSQKCATLIAFTKSSFPSSKLRSL